MKIKRLETIHYTILLVLSFFLLLFCTKSSPLFYLNDWVDANAYMTMGKGMMSGLVPFKDLFEQKGPLLYLIHGIAYLMSPGTFYGIYVFESIGLCVSLIFMYKISRYYMTGWMALWVSMLLPFLLLAQPYFKYGDSAEEFIVPLMMGLIYTIFTLSQNKDKDMKWYFFWQGFSLACVFWIKFTLIGAWVGFFLAVFFIYLFHRRFAEIGKIILYSMGGFLAATIPWLIYFAINGALQDMIDVYFVFNMFIYPDSGSFFSNSMHSFLLFTSGLFQTNALVYVIAYLGTGIAIFKDDLFADMDSKIILAAAFAANGYFSFYGGKSYTYYFQVFYPFMSIGLLLFMMMILRKKKENKSMQSNVAMTFLVFCYSLALTFSFNQQIRETRFNSDNPSVEIVAEGEEKSSSSRPAQLVFADIMNEKENPTLLNYGRIDMGFYTAADILPINKYFEKPNITYEKYPDIMDEQNELIASAAVDFVVLRGDYMEATEDDLMTDDMKQNYEVVATHHQEYEDVEYTYWLLGRKE